MAMTRRCKTCMALFNTKRHSGAVACPQCGSLKSDIETQTHRGTEETSESGKRRIIFTPKATDYEIQFRCLACTTKFTTKRDEHNRYQCPKCASVDLHPMSPAAAAYPAAALPMEMDKQSVKRLRFILHNYKMILDFRARIDDMKTFLRRAGVPEPVRREVERTLERAYEAADRTHQLKLEDYEKARMVLEQRDSRSG